MDYTFPSYKSLFDEIKRRLRRLRNIVSKNGGELEEQDAFILIIMGDINLRFNTICILLDSKNYDGIFALQRTLFEMQLVFELYMDTDDKDKYLDFYVKKSNYESVIKWRKFIHQSNDDQSGIFTLGDQEKIDEFHATAIDELTRTTNRGHFKVWYELAAGRSTKELSYDYLSAFDYFTSYDEPSNWVHPQRLEAGLTMNFDETLDNNYLLILMAVLRADIRWIISDLEKIARHFNIEKSPKLFDCLSKLLEFDRELLKILDEINQERDI